MKKELIYHYTSLLIFFLLITLYKRWFTSPVYLFFWLGGAIGTLLPDLDHLIYTLISRPQELTSQRVKSLLNEKQYLKAIDLLVTTRHERSMPIFHTAFFQILFLIFSFFIISSSGSLFGTGLVLAFSLHLALDQTKDFFELGHINNWFQNLNLKLDHKDSSFYIFIYVLFIFLISFIFN